MRYLGIDRGTVRVGVALSDETGFLAQGLEVIPVRDEAQLLERVRHLCRTYAVERVVVGLPRNMDGSRGPAAERAERFAALVAEATGLPVTLWDERLTTAAAERNMVSADLSRKRRRQIIDRAAATLILQSFLDAQGAR